jgi:Tfp pilus assembly protein PilP
MPPLSLKGILKKSENEEMVALLKVGNKGVYLVRVGDTIGFREGVNDHVMRIKSIEHQSIIVEAGNLGQVIVVR